MVISPGERTRSAAVMPTCRSSARTLRHDLQRARGGLRQQRLVLPERHRRERHLVAGGENRGRVAAQIPQRHRRAPQDVPAAGALQRIDHGHGHGDGDGAARHLEARILPARQLELLGQAAEIGQTRQESHHVDVVCCAAVALDDLGDAETHTRSNIGKVETDALVVAHWQAPVPARLFARRDAVDQRSDARLQLGLRQPDRIVVHHQRAEGRHHLDDARHGQVAQFLRQRHHAPAELAVDAIAELNDQRGVAAGQKLELRSCLHGSAAGDDRRIPG